MAKVLLTSLLLTKIRKMAFLVVAERTAGHHLVVLPGFLVEEVVGHQMVIPLAFLVVAARVAGHQLVVLPGFMDTKMGINVDTLFAHLPLGLLVFLDINAVAAHHLVSLPVSSVDIVVE
jgi:hypothetical protein